MATIGEGLLSLGQGLSGGLRERWRHKELEEQARGLMGPLGNIQREEWVTPLTGGEEQYGMQMKETYDKEKGLLAKAPGVMQAMLMQKFAPKPREAKSVSGGYLDEQGKFISTSKEKPTDNLYKLGDKVYDVSNPDSPVVVLDDTGAAKDGQLVWSTGPKNSDGNPTEVASSWDKGNNKTKAVFEPGGERMSRLATGLTGEMSLSKPFVARLNSDLEISHNAQTRMQNIQASFQPEFLMYKGQIAGTMLSLLDKIVELPEGPQKKWLQEFSTFRQDTNANVNLYIKEITGAQMGEDEATRLTKAVANLDDSPAVFAAKLQNAMRLGEIAIKKKEEVLKSMLREGNPYDVALRQAEKAAISVMRGVQTYNPSESQAAAILNPNGPELPQAPPAGAPGLTPEKDQGDEGAWGDDL